jgi:hypothetical protein
MSDDRERHERGWAVRSGTCPSGKIVYYSRKQAREHSRRISNQTGKMRPYQCPECDNWHIGHLPRAVRQGEVAADEYYRGELDTKESSD